MRKMILQLFGGGGGRSGARPRVPVSQAAGAAGATGQATETKVDFNKTISALEDFERRRKEIEARVNALKKESYEHMGRSKADREAYERITNEMNQLLPGIYQLVTLEAHTERLLKEEYPKEFEKYRKSRQGEKTKTKTRSAYNPNQGGASRGF